MFKFVSFYRIFLDAAGRNTAADSAAVGKGGVLLIQYKLVSFLKVVHLLSVLEFVGQPIETLVETITSGGACGLDVPFSVPHLR